MISVLNTSFGDGGVYNYIKGNRKSLTGEPSNRLYVSFHESGECIHECRSYDAFQEGNYQSGTRPPNDDEFENYRGRTNESLNLLHVTYLNWFILIMKIIHL